LRTNGLIAALACATLALLVAGPAIGVARPHATPAPTPTPVADPAITKIARQQFVQWQAGTVNKSLYAPQVIPKLTDEKIADTARALGQLGALTDMVYIGRWINPEMPTLSGYIYQMRCAEGNVYLWLELQPDGKIASIVFKNRLDVENVTPGPSPTPTPPEPEAL
jgi:hypothetical protein